MQSLGNNGVEDRNEGPLNWLTLNFTKNVTFSVQQWFSVEYL